MELFVTIYDFFKKNKIALWSIFISTLLLFGFFASKLRFIEDISAIIPADNKTKKLTEVFQNSKFADKLAVIVSLKDSSQRNPDSLVAYADSFAEHLTNRSDSLIKQLRYKIDDDITIELFRTIQDQLPVFLTEKDYLAIDSLQDTARIRQTLANDIKLLSSPAGFALKEIISNDPSGISFIALKKLQQLQVDDNFDLYDGHIITKDQQFLLLFITPNYPAANTGKNKALLSLLDNTVDSLSINYPSIDAGYFGAAAVAAGNATQLRMDTMLTQGITVLFLVIFIGLYFKRKRAPVLILFPVIYGALFSLALIYFLKGSVSVIALGTGSLVLGIAVNYSLHVFNHFRHTGNMREVVKELSFPLTIGGLTTIGGFFCLQFAKSVILQDLGLFAALSLIGAALASLIFLPHFSAGKQKETATHSSSWIDRLAELKPEKNKWLIAGIFGLTIVFLFFFLKVQFEPNMESLNYMAAPLKKTEQRLDKASGFSARSLYVVTEGDNLEQALRKNEQLEKQLFDLQEKGSVKSFAGVSSLYLSDSLQQQRIQQWKNYWTTDRQSSFLASLKKEGISMGFSSTAFDNFQELLAKEYATIDKVTLADLRTNFLDDYITEQPNKTSIVSILKVSPEQKQTAVAALDGKSDVTVLDRQYLSTRLSEMVNEDFNKVALFTSALVFFVLLLTFGRIELALVSFIPMLLSWVWILGIMAIAGIEFNIVNIIVSALIFGLGDDYSLFIMEGLLLEYKTGKKIVASYKSSIILSAITTIAGLGVLLLAKHPALQSIAFISVTGILCVLLMSQVLIPFFFSILIKNRVAKKRSPWTLWSWLVSIFSFTYFALGSIVLTIIGVILIRLNPFNKEKGKKVYHWLLKKLTGSVLYIMGNFRKVVNNPWKEDFSKPAVIIANHQSFLDILALCMLSSKTILLTNKWVWKSPVFGAVVKLADFYPVADGIENSIELMRDRVKQGYSIIVFPEGTRTSEPPMKRFHKGAFYLAEQLQLDIVPIILHGTGYTMTKGDFLLKNGTITVQYLPRIAYDDERFGTGYAERTKKISRYFKAEYEQVRKQLEPISYFREKLIHNYIYKGPVLEWYLRVKIRLEKDYTFFDEIVPRSGKILDIGCGYGFMSYMLHFASNEREITGIDYDEEKILTANHCYSKDEGIQFVHTSVTDFSFEKYNAIIISDVLHYLQAEQQINIINKSINSLEPGGVLIIREGDKEKSKRHSGTRLTEFLSTRVLNFNKTTSERLSFMAGSTISGLATNDSELAFEQVDNTRYTSNVIFIIRKKQKHATV